MSPAEELRAAAAKVRAVAEAVEADRRAWFTKDEITDAELTGDCVWSTVTGADAAWIALAHPGLAEHLAPLLDLFAAMYEVGLVDAAGSIAALNLARDINGGAS